MTVEQPHARDVRLELRLAMLRRRAIECGFITSADDRISERHAAELLAINIQTLRRMRAEGSGPSFYDIGVAGSKISYWLPDVAEFMERRRDRAQKNMRQKLRSASK